MSFKEPEAEKQDVIEVQEPSQEPVIIEEQSPDVISSLADFNEKSLGIVTSTTEVAINVANMADSTGLSGLRNVDVYSKQALTQFLISHPVPDGILFGASLLAGIADAAYLYRSKKKTTEQQSLDYVLQKIAALSDSDEINPAEAESDLVSQIKVLQNLLDSYQYLNKKNNWLTKLTHYFYKSASEDRLELLTAKLLASNETPTAADNTDAAPTNNKSKKISRIIFAYIPGTPAYRARKVANDAHEQQLKQIYEKFIKLQLDEVKKELHVCLKNSDANSVDGAFFAGYAQKYEIKIAEAACEEHAIKFGELQLKETIVTRQEIEKISFSEKYQTEKKKKNRFERVIKAIAESKFGQAVGLVWNALNIFSLFYWIGWFALYAIAGLLFVIRPIAVLLAFGLPALLPVVQFITSVISRLNDYRNFVKERRHLEKAIMARLAQLSLDDFSEASPDKAPEEFANIQSGKQKFSELKLAYFYPGLVKLKEELKSKTVKTKADAYTDKLITSWLEKLKLYRDCKTNQFLSKVKFTEDGSKVEKSYAKFTIEQFIQEHESLTKKIAQQTAADTFNLQRGLFVKLRAEHYSAKVQSLILQKIKASSSNESNSDESKKFTELNLAEFKQAIDALIADASVPARKLDLKKTWQNLGAKWRSFTTKQIQPEQQIQPEKTDEQKVFEDYAQILFKEWQAKIKEYNALLDKSIQNDLAEISANDFFTDYEKYMQLAEQAAAARAAALATDVENNLVEIKTTPHAFLLKIKTVLRSLFKQQAATAVPATATKNLKPILPEYAHQFKTDANRSRRITTESLSGFMNGFIGAFFASWPITALLMALGISAAGGPVVTVALLGVYLLVGVAYAVYRGVHGSLEYKKDFNETLKQAAALEKNANYNPSFNLDTLEPERSNVSRYSRKLFLRCKTFLYKAWSGSLFNRALFQAGSSLDPSIFKVVAGKTALLGLASTLLGVATFFSGGSAFLITGAVLFAVWGTFKVFEYHKNRQDLKYRQKIDRVAVANYDRAKQAEVQQVMFKPVEQPVVSVISINPEADIKASEDSLNTVKSATNSTQLSSSTLDLTAVTEKPEIANHDQAEQAEIQSIIFSPEAIEAKEITAPDRAQEIKVLKDSFNLANSQLTQLLSNSTNVADEIEAIPTSIKRSRSKSLDSASLVEFLGKKPAAANIETPAVAGNSPVQALPTLKT